VSIVLYALLSLWQFWLHLLFSFEEYMKLFKLSLVVLGIMAVSACTRVETGEVGLRVGFDKQVKNEELLPGSFNQIIIGDVLTFPIKEVAVKVEDMTPLAKDNRNLQQ
jgi:hypothetical protein